MKKPELIPYLQDKYPKLKIVEKGDNLLSICKTDENRCLSPKDKEEDYSIWGKNDIIRVFTTYAPNCNDCDRNS